MAYEIFEFPRISSNLSESPVPPFDVYQMYNYGSFYNYSIVLEPTPVFPRVHIAAKILVGVSFSLMISVCGVGNLLLCYVIYRFRRMRTTTNLLIGNLALSDFLVAVICAPFNFYFYVFQNWPFGSALCAAVGYLKITSLYVSTNSLLAIAIDRYIVITYPLKPRMTRGTTGIILALIWLISITFTIPAAIHSDLYAIQFEDGAHTVQCSETWMNAYALKAYALLMVIGEFLIPLVAMCVAYYLIAKTLWFRKIPGGHNTEAQEQAAESSKRRTIRMLIIVVALFALCWAPYHGFAITRDVIIPTSTSDNFVLYHTLFYVVEALAMSNSIFNTLIYIVFNANFRKCVMQIRVPRAFHHVMRHSSTKTRSSRPTSNFRMGTYHRSNGPDNKSLGQSSPSRSPAPRRQPTAGSCFSSPNGHSLVPPASTNTLSPNACGNIPLNNNVEFIADHPRSDENSQQAQTPHEDSRPQIQSPNYDVHSHHVVAGENGKIVLVFNNESGVGSQV